MSEKEAKIRQLQHELEKIKLICEDQDINFDDLFHTEDMSFKKDEIPFDGLYIKKIPPSNTLLDNSQTHIAITGEKRDMFPYLYNYIYLESRDQEEKETEYKRTFLLELTVNLMSKNLHNLKNNIPIYSSTEQVISDHPGITSNSAEKAVEYSSKLDEKKEIYSENANKEISSDTNFDDLIDSDVNQVIKAKTYCARSLRSDDSEQIEIGYLSEDSASFNYFRSLWRIYDYLIILKLRTKLIYTMIVVRKEDVDKFELNEKVDRYGQLFIRIPKEITHVENSRIKEKSNTIPDTIPYERIITGAPAVGKTHYLNEQKEEYFPTEDLYTRVTFHPRYSYNDFVGSYKPVSIYQETDKKIYESDMTTERDRSLEPLIDYTFVAGPFLDILCKAINNDNKNFLLLIEEINRAEAASVFGQIFQLLDRDNSGASKFPIKFNSDIMNYIKKETGKKLESVKLPNNLYIWATMNSTDQGIKPMDTAFKRRWTPEYIQLNQFEKVVDDINIKLSFMDNEIKWNDLRNLINDQIKDVVPEDRLVGPFFMTDNELNDDRAIKNKLLMYLRQDVLRHQHQKLFKYDSFSEILQKYDAKKNIFNKEFYVKLEEKAEEQEEV